MRRIFLCVLLVILFCLGAFFLRHIGNAPVHSHDSTPHTVEIPSQSKTRDIAKRLHDAGVLRSPFGFLLRVKFTTHEGSLKAGTYEFSKAESGANILRRLRAGDAVSKDITVTIPEGFTVQEIAQRLSDAHLVPKDDFIKTAVVVPYRKDFDFLQSVPNGSLEGYLFPDTYRFLPGTSADAIVRRMLSRFQDQITIVLKEGKGLNGHTLHQVITMASIVEREVRTDQDRRLVAGILWSRYDKGVGLAVDATLRYTLNNWDTPLTVKDLATNSPYNTRKFAGLPPGPIGSPGVNSLQATLNPQDSDYFYYLSSAKDRTTIFSKTLEEHNKAIQEHLR